MGSAILIKTGAKNKHFTYGWHTTINKFEYTVIDICAVLMANRYSQLLIMVSLYFGKSKTK